MESVEVGVALLDGEGAEGEPKTTKLVGEVMRKRGKVQNVIGSVRFGIVYGGG